MSQILGIKFSDHGPVCYFASGAHVLRLGQSVLVETDQGLALGRVATVAAPEMAQQDAHIVAEAPPVQAAPAPVESGPAPFEVLLGSADWDAGSPDEVVVEIHAVEIHAASIHAVDIHAVGAAPEQAQEASAPGGVYSLEQAAQYQPRPSTSAGLQSIYRLATSADLDAHAENRRLARRAFNFCRGCIHNQNLDMKLVDVEVLHDRSKMVFYFTAPNRIDFRELIKSLVREFHTRIELRQIGVRHETQMIGALGNCGQVCCCRRFLRKFAPVTIKMAKEQNLFLNPAKISGICGRLLCCLSYEQKGYEEFHKQCPKIGKRVQTAIGSVKVLRANFFKKSISVWVEDAGEREYTLDEWKELVNRQAMPEGSVPSAEVQQERQEGRQGRQAPGRQRESRPSTGRPSRTERPGRPERPERSERSDRSDRSDRPEPRAAEPQAAAPATVDAAPGARAEVRPEPGPEARGESRGTAEHPARPEGEAARTRPRRKRRKGRGPKPA